jgi:hypothetical protein
VYSLNLLQNKRAFWIMQIAGVVLFFVFGWFFIWWALQVRSTLFQGSFLEGLSISLGNSTMLLFLVVMLVSTAVAIFVHELVHGAFFWLYSRSRPRFGFRGGYAYAAAPGWFFPRRQYLVIALAPLVLLSILGMVLVAIVPAGAIVAILFGLVANAAGAVGDMWIAFKVMRERRKIVVEDLGDGMNFYALS